MTPDQYRRAHAVVSHLAGPDVIPDAVKAIKAQRWTEVCAAIEANPDLSATTIAERLGATPISNRDTAPSLPSMTATTERSTLPTESQRTTARERIDAIRQQLASKET